MEKLERYVLRPSIKLFGGIEVEEDTEFDTWNDEMTVHQTFKDGVLTTELVNEWETAGIKNREESKLVSEIPIGTVLIWDENSGYIIPQYKMQKVTDACKEFTELMEAVLKHDAERTETCDTEIN